MGDDARMNRIITDYGLQESAKGTNALVLVHADDWAAWCEAAEPFAKNWIKAHAFSGKAGTALIIPTDDGGINAAIGVIGKHDIWDGARLAKALPPGGWHIDPNQGTKLDTVACEMLALGWALSQYSFDTYKNGESSTGKSTRLMTHLAIPEGVSADRLLGLVEGVWFCRDLINTPANHMTPQGLEDNATDLAKTFGAAITIVSGNDLQKSFPAINIVGRAAEIAPRLIDFSWGDTGPKITLVGKGITFDSGGLDLKPSKAMEMMKKDMGGSATVLGLAMAIMAAKLPVRLRVLVAAAENAVSDRSMRPLDVIDTRAGIKVEVGNTDAEGRLVLADALTLAREDDPDFVIDFATLTGAARVALGTELPALFCNRDDTAMQILAASDDVGDPLWRLPLFDDYDRHLENGHVTLSSTGSTGFGGAITAALFLRRFAGSDSNWAHIDVMAWNLSGRPGRPRGGEAMGLRAIFRYIEQLAANKQS
jgi:leucyl aminopeptidase